MAKLVDANNPQHKYEPPICRYVSMIPLEADAIRKRGLPILPPYKLHSEPIYSCPRLSRKSGIALFSAKVYEYESLDAKGNKCPREGLTLTQGKRANLSIEHTEFAVRVMWADETGVAELLPGRDLLVQVPREEAARIMKRNLSDGSCIYILGEAPCFHLIRPAIPRDTKACMQPASAIFMLGPVDVYPKARITRVTIDRQELEYYCRGGSSI
jgi:hypothetical protein